MYTYNIYIYIYIFIHTVPCNIVFCQVLLADQAGRSSYARMSTLHSQQLVITPHVDVCLCMVVGYAIL